MIPCSNDCASHLINGSSITFSFIYTSLKYLKGIASKAKTMQKEKSALLQEIDWKKVLFALKGAL